MRIDELEITLPLCRDREVAIRRLREFVPESLLGRYDEVVQLPLADDDPPLLGEDKGCRIWVMCDSLYGFSLTFRPASASSWSLKEAIAVDRRLDLSKKLRDGLEINAAVDGRLREDASAEQQANRTNGLHWSHGLDALK